MVPCERVRAVLTSWTFFALLGLLPLGQLAERLGSLLKFGDEELDVVQDVVQDLLQKKKGSEKVLPPGSSLT